MVAECNTESLGFQPLGRRGVVANFDGGTITSDGGGVLLREVAEKTGVLQRFAECFADHRDPDAIEHSVPELVAQRVYGLALGYEDIADHDELRHDPLIATLVGKTDPVGENRVRERDRGKALAGKSTLNRLELTPAGAGSENRYKKIVADCGAIDELFVDVFLQAHARAPRRIILDLDATDDPLHGHQLGRFFHGYYRDYCYLPLYIFCGEHLLCAKLRTADRDASDGCVQELERIIARIRERWPRVKIIVRGDGGFCREELMAWCEAHEVEFVLGLARNPRLTAEIAPELYEARENFEASGEAARVFRDFPYRTLGSWSRERRVIGKAEYLRKGQNPRFVVTSLSANEFEAAALYEALYCGRGDMENRIKEQQLFLFADRTSCETMRANQLRLYFSSVAYVLMTLLRQYGVKDTPLEGAQCDTIRLKLLKIGAQVRVTFRKVWLMFSESYPYQSLFRAVYENLQRIRFRPFTPLRC